tara:strand:+ start:652 stop:1233 length:582 start_codon:yes stop_codon:yes gene_type:complete
MSWRAILIVVFIAALIGLGVWLDELLTARAWGVVSGKSYSVSATGWSILFHAWPIALAGLLVAGFLGSFPLVSMYVRAESADHREVIEVLRSKLNASDERARTAEERAKKEALALVSESLKDAEEYKNRSIAAFREAKILQSSAEIEIENARDAVAESLEAISQANRRAKVAEYKCSNATQGFSRVKRKLGRN